MSKKKLPKVRPLRDFNNFQKIKAIEEFISWSSFKEYDLNDVRTFIVYKNKLLNE